MHVTVTAAGEVTSADEVEVTVALTATETSAPDPVENVNVELPVLPPAHPSAKLTVYVRPTDWFEVLRVVIDGAVTTTPPGIVPNVTARNALPVSAVTGLTVIDTGVPGPVVVLQVTVAVFGVAVSRLAPHIVPVKTAKTKPLAAVLNA